MGWPQMQGQENELDYMERVCSLICLAWNILQGSISLECGAQILSVNLILKRKWQHTDNVFQLLESINNVGKVDC